MDMDDSLLTLNSTTTNVNAHGLLNLVDALLTNKLNEEKQNAENNKMRDNNEMEGNALPETISNGNDDGIYLIYK